MDERKFDLRDAIPDTPDMCRDAVLNAVHTYQEGRNVRKPYMTILVAVLAMMLLCGTAFAIANYYSVRDYLANGNPSAAFEENIIPLEKSVTSHGLTFTLGDAVFDGTDLAFTMNIAVEENAEPMFVWPDLRAYSEGEELELDCLGTDVFSDLGAFIPSYAAEHRMLSAGDQGWRAHVFGKYPESEVTWRYTIHLYKPTGEVIKAREWKPSAESYDEWEAYLRGLHQEGKIGYMGVGSILDWMDAVVLDRDTNDTYGDNLLRTGLFEPADTIVFEFTTAMPEKNVLISGESFPFDGYTVTVDTLTQSFMQLDYALTVTFDEPYQGHEHYLDQFYDLSDQNGVKLRRRTATLVLADDRMSCSVTGSVERISDEPLTAITFTRKVYDWPDDMLIPAFTVDLTK